MSRALEWELSLGFLDSIPTDSLSKREENPEWIAELSTAAAATEATEQQRQLFYDYPRRRSLEIVSKTAEAGSWFAKLGRTASHSRRETQGSCIGQNIASTLGDSESTHDLL